jgi:hypothetical protein
MGPTKSRGFHFHVNLVEHGWILTNRRVCVKNMLLIPWFFSLFIFHVARHFICDVNLFLYICRLARLSRVRNQQSASRSKDDCFDEEVDSILCWFSLVLDLFLLWAHSPILVIVLENCGYIVCGLLIYCYNNFGYFVLLTIFRSPILWILW